MSDSLWPHGPQHARLLCPSKSPGVCSNSASIESVMLSNHLILCHPLLLLPLIFVSIRVCSSKSALHIRSDQISLSVVSDSLRPHESQHTRPPCPSPTPSVHWDPNTGASVSVSVLPILMQHWFPVVLSGLISLQSKGLSRVFSSSTVRKHQLFGTQPSLWSNFPLHDY